MSSDSRRPGFSIQSKLLVMLLAVSIGSSLVVGLVGYTSGSDSLRQAAFDRVTEMRQSKATQITDFFKTTEDSLAVYTRGTTAINAVKAFTAGYDQLQSQPVSAADTARVDALYTNTFAPQLAARSGADTDPAAFIPADPAEVYLQSHYTDPALDATKSSPSTPRATAARGRPRTPRIRTTFARSSSASATATLC